MNDKITRADLPGLEKAHSLAQMNSFPVSFECSLEALIAQAKAAQDERAAFESYAELAKEAFGKVVDHDFSGNPITDYDVILNGAYGPAVRRLVCLAISRTYDLASQPSAEAEVVSVPRALLKHLTPAISLPHGQKVEMRKQLNALLTALGAT